MNLTMTQIRIALSLALTHIGEGDMSPLFGELDNDTACSLYRAFESDHNNVGLDAASRWLLDSLLEVAE